MYAIIEKVMTTAEFATNLEKLTNTIKVSNGIVAESIGLLT